MPNPALVSADYMVVVSNEDDHLSGFHHFSEKVNRKLKVGYQLHGQPFAMGKVMCQAMIRIAGPARQGDTTFFHTHPAAPQGYP